MQDLRYCHGTGAWFQWNGSNWSKNEKDSVLNAIRWLTRNFSRSEEPKVKAAVQKSSFARVVDRFCRADPSCSVTIDAWDHDPFKLGTPEGTVELKTGFINPGESHDYITKMTAVGPAAEASCPRWLGFLSETTGNDVELIRFLQQWCGYCLTGVTREHALVFVYGGGGNGKSVFLNTVTRILGDYATTASMDTFIAS